MRLEFEPQRILGSVVRTLHEQPLLTTQVINDTLNSNPVLAPSNLADEIERVKFTPADLCLDDMSKLWSVFFQIPYTLSAAYQASVVFIESQQPPRQALPVRRYFVYALPFQQPTIEKLTSAEGGKGTRSLRAALLWWRPAICGADDTWLRVAGVMVEPDPNQVTANPISITPSLPASSLNELRAGVQGVQVVHRLRLGEPAAPHQGFELNVAPLLVHPKITDLQVANPQTNADGTRSPISR